MSREQNAARRPIATPNSQNAVDPSLHQESHHKPMVLGEGVRNMLEKEDDIGQIQQVSGGFGDSTNLDEATLKKLQEMQ